VSGHRSPVSSVVFHAVCACRILDLFLLSITAY
jgi:hypothetical protein